MVDRHAIRLMMTGTALALLTGGATAQSTPVPGGEAIELQPVVISSERITGTGAFAGTATTTTTTRNAIENRSIETISDLGRRQEAGVTFNRANRSVNVRGLDGARVLTTIDGIRVPYLADATRGASGGVDAFDFNTLSAVHLTRGADPTLGSSALGGVLALRTLEPGDLLLGGRPVGVFTRKGYDGQDRSWFASGAVAMRRGDTSVLLQGGYRRGEERRTQGDVGGIGAARTQANPLDYDQSNLLGKIYREFGEGHRIGLTGEIFSRDDDSETLTTQSATGIYRAGNHFSGEDVERRRVALTYDYRSPERGGLVDEAAASLYHQTLERGSTVDAFRASAPLGRFERDNSLDEAAVGFIGHAARDWQLGALASRFTVGTELRRATLTQYSAGFDNCPIATTPAARMSCSLLHTNQADSPKAEGSAIGLFAQNEFGFLDGRLRLTPGLRYDWYEEEPEPTAEYRRNASFRALAPSSSGDAFSPKVLAEYDLLPDLTMFGQWTQGFRAPTAGELYARFGGPGTYLRLGNPKLEAETSNGFDAGIRLERETHGAFLTVFHTEYENFIEAVQLTPRNREYPLGGISSQRNVPDARIAGVELGGHLRFADFWTARGSFAYAEGRNRTDGTWLNSVSPLTAIVGLGYDRAHWGAEVSAKLAAERDKVSTTGFRAPGYGVVDLTAWVEPEKLPGLKIAGGVFNLFDKTYYDAVSVPVTRSQPDEFYSEPGRSLKVNVIYRF